MPVPSQGHCGFPSFQVVDWFWLFVDLWVLPFSLEDCSVFGNFVIIFIYSFWLPLWYLQKFLFFMLNSDLYHLFIANNHSSNYYPDFMANNNLTLTYTLRTVWLIFLSVLYFYNDFIYTLYQRLLNLIKPIEK